MKTYRLQPVGALCNILLALKGNLQNALFHTYWVLQYQHIHIHGCAVRTYLMLQLVGFENRIKKMNKCDKCRYIVVYLRQFECTPNGLTSFRCMLIVAKSHTIHYYSFFFIYLFSLFSLPHLTSVRDFCNQPKEYFKCKSTFPAYLKQHKMKSRNCAISLPSAIYRYVCTFRSLCVTALL